MKKQFYKSVLWMLRRSKIKPVFDGCTQIADIDVAKSYRFPTLAIACILELARLNKGITFDKFIIKYNNDSMTLVIDSKNRNIRIEDKGVDDKAICYIVDAVGPSSSCTHTKS